MYNVSSTTTEVAVTAFGIQLEIALKGLSALTLAIIALGWAGSLFIYLTVKKMGIKTSGTAFIALLAVFDSLALLSHVPQSVINLVETQILQTICGIRLSLIGVASGTGNFLYNVEDFECFNRLRICSRLKKI